MRWIQGSSTWIRTSRVWPRHKHAHTRTHQRSAVSGGSFTLSSTGAKSYRHPQIMHLLYSRQRNTRHVPVSGPPSTEYFTTTPSYYLTLPWKTNPGCVTSGMGWFHANTEHDTPELEVPRRRDAGAPDCVATANQRVPHIPRHFRDRGTKRRPTIDD